MRIPCLASEVSPQRAVRWLPRPTDASVTRQRLRVRSWVRAFLRGMGSVRLDSSYPETQALVLNTQRCLSKPEANTKAGSSITSHGHSSRGSWRPSRDAILCPVPRPHHTWPAPSHPSHHTCPITPSPSHLALHIWPTSSHLPLHTCPFTPASSHLARLITSVPSHLACPVARG